MKKIKKIISSVFILLMCVSILPSNGAAADGETYFTKVNIWYEKPDKILSTNYHKGIMIPAGTEVEILKRGKKISFRDLSTSVVHRLVLVKKYTSLSKSEFFDRYFSSENVTNGSKYKSFSAVEKRNIESGGLEEGMGKEAALIAYGYPPSHMTPSTETNMWTYWESRFDRIVVQFQDNKIIDIKN